MPDPVTPANATEDLFRQAILQNNAIHAQALADLQRRSDEAFGQLRQLTSMHMFSQSARSTVNLILYAGAHDPDFLKRMRTEAEKILQQHGVLPPSNEPTPDPAKPTPDPATPTDPTTPTDPATPQPGGDAVNPGGPFPAQLPLLRTGYGRPGKLG
jgi:hypothetical protein